MHTQTGVLHGSQGATGIYIAWLAPHVQIYYSGYYLYLCTALSATYTYVGASALREKSIFPDVRADEIFQISWVCERTSARIAIH